MNKTGTNQLPNDDQKGMSLMEVMVSMVMMGAVLVGLGQGLTLGIRMNTESKLRVSNLNLCKQVAERVKSQIQYSQAIFDTAEASENFNRSFQTDADGKVITNDQAAPSPNFIVTTSVTNWTDAGGNTLSAIDSNGVSHVLVKALNVRVVAQTSAITSMRSTSSAGSTRETTLRVEMVRPAS